MSESAAIDTQTLDRVTVSSSSPIPLHLQLSANLRKQMAEGQLAPGMALPTVQALAKRCRMSQATVMRAMSELASEGLIVTRRGARSVVAARRAASTEILFGNLTHAPTSRDMSFFNQLLDGLREGCRDPERRFMTTYLDATPIHAAELLRVCQVSNADGIVAYRPQGLVARALQETAPQLPVVTLFYPVPGSAADCVQADPAPALRTLLLDRIAQGKRHFWYVGAISYLLTKEPSEYSPYARIYRALQETVRGAGLKLSEVDQDDEAFREKAARIGKGIPDGAVLVAGHPSLALACEGDRPRLDMISYTEYRGTLELAMGRMTTLYLGVDTVGLAAAELLQSRIRSGNSLPSRTMLLSPKVLA